MFRQTMPIDPNKYQLSPLRIAVIYALMGGLWILISDAFLAALVTDKAVITCISIFKGWLFVVVTGGLLYWLIRRYAGTQRSAAVKIERLNNLYRAIVSISEAILRIKDRNKLFSEACRLAVEESGLRMAWIGLVEEKDKAVRPAASCGVVDGYLDHIRISIDPDIPEGQGPTGIALREGRNFICNDIENDPRMLPWREQALKRGYRSSVAFPLKSESRIVGSLNLYAPVPSFFDDEELMLIENLAADLSLAIAVIRQEDERVKAEEALRESEGRYRTVVEQATDGIFITDGRGRFVDVNMYGCQMHGYTREEMLRLGIADLVLPAEAAHIGLLFEALACGERVLGEWQARRKDGSAFMVETNASRLSSGGYLGIVRDITERKKAEESLKRNENMLHLFVENSPAAIAMLDRNMKYIMASRRFLIDYDLGDRNIVGHSHYEVFPEIPDRWREIHRRCLAGAVERSEEDPFLRADGKTDWVRWEIRPWHEKGDEIGGIILFSEVITARKRAEEELRESEEKFRQIAESIQEVFWMTDSEKNRMLYVSPAYEKIWDRTRQSLYETPKAWLEAIHPDDRDKVLQAALNKQAAGTYDEEYRVLRPDGSLRWIRDKAFPIRDKDGRVYRVAGIAEDITERKHLGEQLRQAQKMESIGTLAGGVAHDFNNILSAIIGYGHVALMKMAGDDPQRSNIESMLEAADRAAHLTKDLLLFSRKQVSELKPVDLNKVVGQVEKFLKRVIGEDIACKKTVTDHPLTVFADSHQLEQVLMNLATNAHDAMPKGGTFTVTTEQADLHEDFTRAHGYGKPGVYAMLTVSDTGKGMDEETRKRIFEPFFTTKEVGKGTGLGLAVVYGIIKQHDGFINVYSEPGKGTTFRIYLPIIGAVVTEETAAQIKEAPARGTETVLLAEDDETVWKLSRTVLAEYGYTVIEAVDGEDAVRKFMENKESIHILLFDLIMPKMNGKEAYDEIRKIRPDMKVLFSSGYAPDIVWQKASLEPGSHLIYKPVSPIELLRKVRSVLDGATQ